MTDATQGEGHDRIAELDVSAAGNAADVWSLSSNSREYYFTSMLPVEVHCHGFASADFSEFMRLDLRGLDKLCAEEGVLVIPTLYLHHDRLDEFERFMVRYSAMRRDGVIPRIVGIALEGPLLASRGGTPASTVWSPTKREWERLASLGDLGLLYTVISPDALQVTSNSSLNHKDVDLEWVVTTLVNSGLRPALGHFRRSDPVRSAEAVDHIIDVAYATSFPGRGARIITDHLFNDMPVKIRYAFRTPTLKLDRKSLLRSYDLPNWRLSDMEEIVGPVPSAIMRGAAAGRVAACVNFDGEHVDLTIAARAAELMGFGNTMMMTDRCDSARLGGQKLHRVKQNSLWYESNGIVAAGSQPLDTQMQSASSLIAERRDVWQLAAGSAYAAFGINSGPQGGSFVHKDSGVRSAVTSATTE
ncbi:amidohydrolase family protein [Nocardia aurea]|uniref:hypothetical protein n=1 Tax=Nocardia aurea TaxID=2144174 RepID=UPI0018E509FE|nr:hypothetical protein [Nocardia aurea]